VIFCDITGVESWSIDGVLMERGGEVGRKESRLLALLVVVTMIEAVICTDGAFDSPSTCKLST